MAQATYANLAQVEPELKAYNQNPTALEVTAGKSYLTDYALPYITNRIDQLTGQTFMPRQDTRPFDATQANVDKYRNQLILDMPLLVATTVTVAGQELTPWTDGIYDNRHLYDYMFVPQYQTPITAFQGLQGFPLWLPTLWNRFPPFLCNGWTLNLYNQTWQNTGGVVDAIVVTGTWGYRTRYTTDAWKLSGDSVQNGGGITDATTTITVNNVNGAQYDGTTPRFSVGQLLLLETEWCEVIGVNTSTNVLTVIRGARGSTAAAHVINTTINIFYPEPAIVRAAVRWASYLYARRAVFEKTTLQFGQGGQYSAVMPMDVPEEVRNILHQFTNLQARV
jgi:hypothetical protein